MTVRYGNVGATFDWAGKDVTGSFVIIYTCIYFTIIISYMINSAFLINIYYSLSIHSSSHIYCHSLIISFIIYHNWWRASFFSSWFTATHTHGRFELQLYSENLTPVFVLIIYLFCCLCVFLQVIYLYKCIDIYSFLIFSFIVCFLTLTVLYIYGMHCRFELQL
jgi:hypothetical protein